MVYTVIMPVNITKFRRDLFQLADQALRGEPVEFIHKGVVFKVVPATRTPKLSRLTRETVVALGANLDTTELLKEMESEWQKDWSEI
jgi:antitoxin (DNA-binding transcriptional repressor) of toxin-antitoxin stability system